MTMTGSGNHTVIHVLGSVDRGGVEMRMLELARQLNGQDVDLAMVTLTGREGSLAAEYKEAGASIVPIRLASPVFAWRFISFIRRNRIRAVHSHVHLASGFILALAALGGARKRIANFSSDGALRSEQPALVRARYAVLRWLLNMFATDIVGIAPSTLSVAWNENWEQDPRCRVLVTGFDLGRFRGTAKGDLRSEIGLGPDEPMIVHVGRADIATKNRDGAIRIFGEYARTHPKGMLVFVGRDGVDAGQAKENRSRWLSLTDQLGITDRVHYAGEREDVPDILASAGLLLFTSTLEGLPGVIVEARAAGTPVLASDVPGASYIAQMISGVRILSLEEPLQVWADAMAEQLGEELTAARRAELAASLRGTDFDIEKAVLNYRRLWSL